MAGPQRATGAARTLGTFGGVFTPSILTILGIILFLRLGWIVGEGGLARALVMIALAHAVSIITSLSLSAIATNRRVRGGGDYFLVSRSLGLQYGGALGLVLFSVQTLSVAFYCLGFGEAAAPLAASMGIDVSVRAVAAVAALVIGLLSFQGADLATRFQFAILAAIAIALASFFVGSAQSFDPATLQASWTTPAGSPSFWVLFAVFFPAVTGFTQGVSLSGDLADPARSLPRGTLSATVLSLFIYAAATVAFAGAAPLSALRENQAMLGELSLLPGTFQIGVMAATLSSGLASNLGAPRILQAVARDRIIPILAPFAKGTGPSLNPRRAVVLTSGVAFVVLALGELNSVARLITMFFLISYGLLNLATYAEASSESPSFRPRFRFFHARLSLLGAALCAGFMFALDAAAALFAIAVMAALYHYLGRTSVPAGWVDSRRAYEFKRLKESLSEIDRHPENEWTWQPHVLALVGDAAHNELSLHMAASLAGGSGLVTAVGLVEGEGDLATIQTARRRAESLLDEVLVKHDIDAYPLVVAAPDFRDAVSTLVQSWGIGPVRANTVLVDWYQRLPKDAHEHDPLWYGRELLGMLRMGVHVLSLELDDRRWDELDRVAGEDRTIDVWWWSTHSSRLALLFAYLVTRNGDWRDARIRLLVPCRAGHDEREQRSLRSIVAEARIDADIQPVVDADSRSIADISAASQLVVLPLRIDGMRVVDPFGGEIESLLPALPSTLLVGAATDVSLTEPETDDETTQGEQEEESEQARESEPDAADS